MLEIDFDLFLNCVIKHLYQKTDILIDGEHIKRLTPDDEDALWKELKLIAERDRHTK